MTLRCRMCRRIRVNGRFRLPWPDEALDAVREAFCPSCAKEALDRLRAGENVYLRVAPVMPLAPARG